MTSRWSSIAVCLLWAITMGWLIAEKVLPPLMLGEPPSYRAIAYARSDQATIGWNVLVNDKRVGSAVSTAVKTAEGSTEIQSHVHFDYLPVEEMAPRGLRALVGPVIAPQAGRVPMDCRSTLTVDREGRLTSFRSALDMQSVRNVVRLDGQVDGGQLTLTIRTTDFSYTTDAYVPPNSLAGDALSPQACLPGLRQGQTWTVPSYSLVRPLTHPHPMEILVATVEGKERIVWNGKPEEVWLVVYHADSGLGIGSDKTPRSRLWVRPDGTVLRQQVMVLACKLTFERLPPRPSAAGAKRLHDR
ncbi:MAG: hypothetical protein ACLQLG_18035 [Thermoguttaceae bacterium]